MFNLKSNLCRLVFNVLGGWGGGLTWCFKLVPCFNVSLFSNVQPGA